LHFFKPVFDCIIVNHALSFIPNPVNYCEHLKLLLKPGGKLILLGLNFYADTSLKQKAIHSFKNYYLNKYVFSVFFKDAKGLLSMKDKQDLTKNGFVFEPTAGMFLRNCLAFFNSKKPIYCFGVFKNTAN
jgi:SAM-dependent methyltransferase